MTKNADCGKGGEEIEGTACSMVKCKIEKVNYDVVGGSVKGLFDIVCSKFQGKILNHNNKQKMFYH